MKITTLAWVLSGAVAVGGIGVGLVACSSDSGGGTTTGTDAGHDTGTTGNPDTGTGNPDTGTGPSDAGMGADCAKAATLHPPKLDAGGTLYCPFSAVGDAGNVYCNAPTQQCCETSKTDNSPSTCVNTGTACPFADSTVWECESPVDCMGSAKGSVCVGHGPIPGMPDPGCSNYIASKFTGTTCEQSPPAGTFVVCEENKDCPSSNPLCVPFSAKGNQLGFCQ